MRVGLSMLTLVPGLSGGSETYARALAAALARRDRPEVTAFVPTLAGDAGGGLATRVVHEYPSSRSTSGRLAAMGRASLTPGRALRTLLDEFDVVHYPLTVPVPKARRSVTVLTLHDVQHHDLPELFPRGERLFRRLAYDRAARSATAVIVPSAFVRDRALATLGLDPSHVHVISLGVDLERFAPGTAPREPFLLYPARPWPHKNHALLLAAFRLLRAEQPELRLVLTGAGTERFAGVDGVDARGAVSDAELLSLLQRATCLVFPSRYEGFGLPPLEAMACGTPVAASRAGSLPEVCGDAAVLFDPAGADAIAAGVREAIARAPSLGELGRVRVASLTWEACATAHARVYEAVASTRS